MYEDAALFFPATDELTLDAELLTVGDEPFEMANLAEDVTGVAGFVFISTMMGGHGPRVKWYSKLGRHQPSFSVSVAAEPRLLASSLPERETRRAFPSVTRWVAQNHVALLSFWREGESWTSTEVIAFLQNLESI